MKKFVSYIVFFYLINPLSYVLSHIHDPLPFLSQFIEPGCLVFDIGAHIGSKSMLYRACGAKVICVEPQPDCCKCLAETFKNDPLVTIVPKGVAAKSGILQLSVCSSAPTISTFSSKWVKESRFTNSYQWDRIIEVEVTTLDELIKVYGVPQFCKIDVENYEYEVLLGLSTPIPYISFETAFEVLDDTIRCVQHLESLGYHSFNFAIGEEAKLVSDFWLSGNEVIQLIQTFAIQDPLVWGDIYCQY